VTGGGAYKYAELIEKKLGLKIAKEPVGRISDTIRRCDDSFLKRVITVSYDQDRRNNKISNKKNLVYDST
jgi:hypothetical protein